MNEIGGLRRLYDRLGQQAMTSESTADVDRRIEQLIAELERTQPGAVDEVLRSLA